MEARAEEIPERDHAPGAQRRRGFAASGTCLVVQGDRSVWFGTGGANVSRVFRSDDRGQSWDVHETPIRAGNATSGILSLAFHTANRGVAIGGDYTDPEQTDAIVAWTSDGGRNWTLPRIAGPTGYRSAVVFVPGTTRPTLVAVGRSGRISRPMADKPGFPWEKWGSMPSDLPVRMRAGPSVRME